MERSDHLGGCPTVPAPLVTAISASKQARVMVALPWQKSVSPLTAFAVSQLMERRRMSCILHYSDAFVSHSRNSCADAFLASDMDWLLSIDDDVIPPIGSGKENADWFNAYTGLSLPEKFAGQNALDRLLSHGKSLISGLYWGRNLKGKAMYSEGANNPQEAEWARKGPHDCVRETRWAATGFQLAHRSVFEAIEKRFPRLARGANKKGGQWYSSSEHAAMELIDSTREMLSRGPLSGDTAHKALMILEAGAADARRKSTLGCGEDVQFALRAKDAGHPSFIDHGLWLGHVGLMVFHGKNTTA